MFSGQDFHMFRDFENNDTFPGGLTAEVRREGPRKILRDPFRNPEIIGKKATQQQ